MANIQDPRPRLDDQNRPLDNFNRQLDSFNPQAPLSPVLQSSEENYPPLEECQFEFKNDSYELNIALFAVRCLTTFSCLIGIILLLVNFIRGNKIKSWRLYFTTALSVLAWIAMTLYSDKIDYFCYEFLDRSLQTAAIYKCFQNFLHGFSLYLTLLLLAHLSDMQHRCHWFAFICTSIFVPLLYSVGLVIFDMRVRNQKDWIEACLIPQMKAENQDSIWTCDVKKHVSIAIDCIRTFFYNLVTTIILVAMSKSFCTSRLYGTYSEKRSKVVILVSRWTYSFLLLHNLVAITRLVIDIITRLDGLVEDTSTFTLTHEILSEIELILVILAIPMSYLMGSCPCRRNVRELDTVDKIYTDVWTTPSARNPSSLVNSRPTSATSGGTTSGSHPISAASGSRPASAATNTNPSGHMTSAGLQNGVVARRNHGSNSTLSSLNSSIDSVGELPSSRIGTNPGGGNGSDRKRRVRESYMEAVSMGSLNDDRGSMTSEPIDL